MPKRSEGLKAGREFDFLCLCFLISSTASGPPPLFEEEEHVVDFLVLVLFSLPVCLPGISLLVCVGRTHRCAPTFVLSFCSIVL